MYTNSNNYIATNIEYNHKFQSKSKFIELQKIVVCNVCDGQDCLISELNGLSQFLTLDFNCNKNNYNMDNRHFDSCNYKRNEIFWQVNTNFSCQVQHVVAEADGEIEYYKKVNLCLKRLFSNIKNLFIISQIPIDFTLEIDSGLCIFGLHHDTKCKQLKQLYEQYFAKSFASQFDGHNECKIPFDNKYCVAMSRHRIESQYLTRKRKSSYFGKCCSIKFVVKTAMETLYAV